MSTAARLVPLSGTFIRDLVSLTKPRITAMVVLTTAGGMWLAPQRMSILVMLTTLAATALVVASANSLNCWFERDVDKHMARTKRRPLPAGRISARVALFFGLSLGAVAVPVLTVTANPLTGALAALALISYVWVYTPLKQRSWTALLVGAIPGALPPLMGWTAVTGELSAPGLALFALLFVWQLPHFLAISIFREQEYTKAGIQVLPATHGPNVAKRHAVFYSILLIPVSLLMVPLGIAGAVYGVVASILGLGFLGMAVRGLHVDAGPRWARRFFLASLVYLPVLFGALAFDVIGQSG